MFAASDLSYVKDMRQIMQTCAAHTGIGVMHEAILALSIHDRGRGHFPAQA